MLSSGREGITPIGFRNRKMGVLRYSVLLSFASTLWGGIILWKVFLWVDAELMQATCCTVPEER